MGHRMDHKMLKPHMDAHRMLKNGGDNGYFYDDNYSNYPRSSSYQLLRYHHSLFHTL